MNKGIPWFDKDLSPGPSKPERWVSRNEKEKEVSNEYLEFRMLRKSGSVTRNGPWSAVSNSCHPDLTKFHLKWQWRANHLICVFVFRVQMKPLMKTPLVAHKGILKPHIKGSYCSINLVFTILFTNLKHVIWFGKTVDYQSYFVVRTHSSKIDTIKINAPKKQSKSELSLSLLGTKKVKREKRIPSTLPSLNKYKDQRF